MVLELPDTLAGGLGCAALETLLGGMELLGKLCTGGKSNEQAFNAFWDLFLLQVDDRYADTSLRKILRQVVQNGAAHAYLAQNRIEISKDGKGHLAATPAGALNVDVAVLLEHFRAALDLMKGELERPQSHLLPIFEQGYLAMVMELTRTDLATDHYSKLLPEYPGLESQREVSAAPGAETLRQAAACSDTGVMELLDTSEETDK
jgi:hypothetical protein